MKAIYLILCLALSGCAGSAQKFTAGFSGSVAEDNSQEIIDLQTQLASEILNAQGRIEALTSELNAAVNTPLPAPVTTVKVVKVKDGNLGAVGEGSLQSDLATQESLAATAQRELETMTEVAHIKQSALEAAQEKISQLQAALDTMQRAITLLQESSGSGQDVGVAGTIGAVLGALVSLLLARYVPTLKRSR